MVPRPRIVEPEIPAADPLSDTAEVGGLHKFDLGMVPASITPPRTWRRAAWFAIGSSAAALGGLMFVTALFASGHNRLEGLDLPNMPQPVDEYPPLPDPYFLTGDPSRPHASRSDPADLLATPDSAQPTPQAARSDPMTFDETEPLSAQSTAEQDEQAPPSSTSPPQTREAPTLLPLTDTDGMRRRSDRYYAAISAGDLPGAYAMTGGQLHAEGYRAFAARYSFATQVEVLSVDVSPTTTVHKLRLTLPDGSQRIERHALRYDTSGDESVIVSDDRLS